MSCQRNTCLTKAFYIHRGIPALPQLLSILMAFSLCHIASFLRSTTRHTRRVTIPSTRRWWRPLRLPLRPRRSQPRQMRMMTKPAMMTSERPTSFAGQSCRGSDLCRRCWKEYALQQSSHSALGIKSMFEKEHPWSQKNLNLWYGRDFLAPTPLSASPFSKPLIILDRVACLLRSGEESSAVACELGNMKGGQRVVSPESRMFMLPPLLCVRMPCPSALCAHARTCGMTSLV